jgi:hypothetical protein
MTKIKTCRPGERGQTIILIAISLISLLAIAALAIDVVTLYVARTEIQLAADAAALAGAKAVADSGFTSLPATDPNYPAAQILATGMANNAIYTVLQQNLVAGSQPTCNNCPLPRIVPPSQGDVPITVTLTSTPPTFFARIWGRSAATIGASATAEAYNPANNSPYTPIAPTNVKPWLIANGDPTVSVATQLVNTTTWTVDSAIIGQTFDLTADCGTGPSCWPLGVNGHNPPQANYSLTGNPNVEYLPATFTASSSSVCPTGCGSGSTVECADATNYAYLSGAPQLNWDNSVYPGGAGGPTAVGTECLIGSGGAGAGSQDTLVNGGPWPNAPFQITAGNGVQSGKVVTTSNSIVTIPIIDTPPGVPLTAGGPVTIDGYLQAFINGVEPGFQAGSNPGDLNITVLNIIGCSSSPGAGPAVVGGQGTSPIAVRLITPP